MDVAGDAQGSRALTILPADLQDRAQRNRAGSVGDPTIGPVYPGSPAAAAAAAAAVPPPARPAAPAPAPPPTPSAQAAPAPPPPPRTAAPTSPAAATEDLTQRHPGEKPSEHVLRLAADVRMLRHALDYVRNQVIDAVEACGREANARAAAQAALANARGAAQAELSQTSAAIQAELVNARAEVQRLTNEANQLRQSLVGAHRQAEQWAEQARTSEARVKSAMFAADRAADDAQRKLDDATRAMAAADERIARMTVESAAHAAAIDQLRKTLGEQTSDLQTARSERDAANQRVAELEALLVREQSRHPRGNMAAIPSVPAAPSAPASSQPVVTTGGPPPSVTNPRTGAGVPTDIYEEHPVALANEIDLAPWQQDALGAWADANHRGVVESVTSEGNTQVAYWAIGRALDNSMKVLVLAPTTERVDKWYDGLRNALPNHRVGKHGGRGGPRMAAFDVVVATAQSAAKEHMFEPGLGVFVVADEVHEFGTDVLSKALDPSYVWRLGLTSSYERDDDGIAMYLDRYFGGALFRLGYDRALAEQAIASFDLALVAVPLSAAERAEYDACAAATLAGGAGGGKAGVRAYLKAIARRDEILSGTTARDSSLRTVAAAIRGAGRGLLVAPSPLVAQHVDRVLAGQSCETTAAGGDGDGRNRRGGKGDDDRDVWQLVTPRDSAETGSAVDLAVMASPPRNRRQLIERMDRILGSQPGGHVRLVVLYVEGSAEDDSLGADAAPIYGVMQHARRLQRFAARDTDALLEFLIAGRRVVELPSDPAADRLNRNADGATTTPFS